MSQSEKWSISPKACAKGFLFSLLLVFASYLVVAKELLTGYALTLTVAGLGLLQAWVVLFFFIKLLKEKKPHWNNMIFIFMVMVIVLVVFGSLWIMYHLNYNLMQPVK
jgi:cytochrome o ubiquinol oxidase operon protein cyoD